MLAAVGLLGAIGPSLFAQSSGVATPSVEFEAASIKPHTSADQQVMMVAQPGGRFTATNIPVRMLIRAAYQLQDDQITGPSWITSDRFDVVAKAELPGAPSVQLLAMLQALLADRFKLGVHREMKDLPIYALVLARRDGALGSKLRPTACPDLDIDLSRPQPCTNISNLRGQLTMRGIPIAQSLPYLAPFVNRVVVDRTGLGGRYDLDLEWAPEALPSAVAPTTDGSLGDANRPSIFTALQEQLGLKLDSTTGPVEVLVVDRIERPSPD